jgi:hypothetical protein
MEPKSRVKILGQGRLTVIDILWSSKFKDSHYPRGSYEHDPYVHYTLEENQEYFLMNSASTAVQDPNESTFNEGTLPQAFHGHPYAYPPQMFIGQQEYQHHDYTNFQYPTGHEMFYDASFFVPHTPFQDEKNVDLTTGTLE